MVDSEVHEILHYVIVYNMPGYLPEMEPYNIEAFTLADAISVVRDEIERMAEDDAQLENAELMKAWDYIINEVNKDFEEASRLDDSGVTYYMPNGYVIEATKYQRSELESMGYDDFN